MSKRLLETGSIKAHLEYNGALEHNQHEQGEQTVVPILVETPEGDAEDLEDEEGGSSMFTEEFCKRGNRDVEFVPAIETLELRGGLGSQSRGLEEGLNGGSGSAGIRKTCKG